MVTIIQTILGYGLGAIIAFYLFFRKTNLAFLIFVFLILGPIWTVLYFLFVDAIRYVKNKQKQ